MTRRSRAALGRSGAWTKVAAALVVLLGLGPFVTALAASAKASHCCADMGGQVAASPAPCQWIAATSCCDNASAVGFTPQPTPPPAILLPVASLGCKDNPGVHSRHELELSPLPRLPLSTIVLLL